MIGQSLYSLFQISKVNVLVILHVGNKNPSQRHARQKTHKMRSFYTGEDILYLKMTSPSSHSAQKHKHNTT